MNFLLDTNILIGAEPTSPKDLEEGTAVIADFLKAISLGRHGMWIHPASVSEIRGDKDEARRETRLVLIRKYSELPSPPGLSPRLLSVLSSPMPGSHHHIDMLLLSAVEADAVDYFVTEDERLHKRALRTGLANRVLYAADALATLRGLFPSIPTPPPHVRATVAHELQDDPIFASLREDYPGFDSWLTKCKREQRRVWIIEARKQYAGLCIVKDEPLPNHSSSGKALKLCTFKVSDAFRGLRYGELLLKTLFSYLVENNYESVFVDVFPKHEYLLRLFEDFGFHRHETKSSGEAVMLKVFRPDAEASSLSALEFNIAFGPHALKMADSRVFVVPIRPQFHRLLFPESEQQLQLKTELHPFSNSIRKAYLCHSKRHRIRAGDILLFYCSQVPQAITAVGIVEDMRISARADELARYVGKRTVYSYTEIERMAKQPVQAILFRLSRFVDGSWPLDLMKHSGIVTSPPQTIVEVHNQEAISWIAKQLNAWR